MLIIIIKVKQFLCISTNSKTREIKFPVQGHIVSEKNYLGSSHTGDTKTIDYAPNVYFYL